MKKFHLIKKEKPVSANSRFCIEAAIILTQALLSFLLIIRQELSLGSLAAVCFACILGIVSISDIDSLHIPNSCVIAAAVLWIVWQIAEGKRDLFSGIMIVAAAFAAACMLFLFAIFAKFITKRTVIGAGDMKLLFVCALYTGSSDILLLYFLSFAFGAVSSIVLLLNRGRYSQSFIIPFGPSISAAAMLLAMGNI